MILPCFSRVIVFAPHPDDAEIGCGGFLWSLQPNRIPINIHVLTCFPREREIETRAAAWALGISPVDVTVYDLPQHELPEHSQSLLHLMEMLREDEHSLILVPAGGDNHQDHRATYDAARRAFREHSILGYEIPRSNWDFSPTVYIPVSEAGAEKKIEAVQTHTSQVCKRFMSREVLKGTLATRGAQIGIHYAEAYEAVRIVLHV